MKMMGSMAFAVAALLLSSCVTTTTGGFNVASKERAERDLVQLANGYFEAGDMAGARRNILSALEINPRSADAYNVLAMVQQHEGDTALAGRTFRQALALDSRNARVHNNYAAFLFATGEYEQAYRQLEIVAADSTYEFRGTVYENLGLSALRTDRPQRAEAAFERALQIDSNLPRAALELAQIKFENGEFAAARDYYNQFLSTRNISDSNTIDSLEYRVPELRHDN